MEKFVQYLIESSLILGVLTVFYRLVLHNERMFHFNRVYLLLSLLLSAVVPLLHFATPVIAENQTQGISYLLGSINVYSSQVQEAVVPVIVRFQMFNWLYLIGVVLLLARLLYGIVRLGGLSRSAIWTKIKGYRVADLPGRFNPFSFFHVIFVNRSLYTDEDLDKIMDHEIAHVRFKHSLDVLIVEVLLIVQWFNPFAWIVRRLLKELHEFQADKEVLRKGASISQYKMLLLFQASGVRLLPVNNFNQSITKKRFKMMTNNSLKKYGVIKALLSLMVVSTVIFFFACDNEYVNEETEGFSSELKGADNALEDEVAYGIVEKMPEFPGGEMGLRKFIAKNVKYPVDAQKKGIQGRVYVSFIVARDGSVKNVEVARSVHETLDNEAVRVVSSMPKWEPGLKQGEYVNVSFTIPINFSLGNGEQVKSKIKTEDKPYVLVDGNEMGYDEFSKINPEQIESVTVLKDKSAIEKFGEMGKNGVIVVKTKLAEADNNIVHVVGYQK